jgi:hypothetical protein
MVAGSRRGPARLGPIAKPSQKFAPFAGHKMKRLFDAFLELPTWQGILLIAIAVCVVFGVAFFAAQLGYRIGRSETRHSPHVTRHLPL